jgi:multidrug efflux pump subunit AcrA (membrane-fusion protein)
MVEECGKMTLKPANVQPVIQDDPAEVSPIDSVQLSPMGNGKNGNQRNGSPSRHPSRLPAARRVSLGVKLALVALALAVVVSGSAGGWYLLHQGGSERPDILTAPVKKGKLAITVKERGMLESANNNDVICHVKSRTQNATVATTIKWVIDDGSHVRKGDLLVELDDSGLVEALKAQNIAVDKANADWISAKEEYNIQLSKNDSDIQSKKTALELARIDLDKYQKGDFPQSLKDVEGRIKVAESDLEQQRDRSAWAQRMLKKGYYTVSQADAEQSKLQSLDLNLSKVAEEKRVLVDPDYGLKKRNETDYKNKLAVAKDDLDRAEAQARANEVKARTDRDTKKSVLDQETAKQKDLQDEIKKCKINAPQDGLVVYYIPEQTRFGSGSQQSTVAQGEPVREGQKLMRIPDLQHMMVNTKVHEALVSAVKGEMRDADGKIVFRGQEARVRTDAYPDHELKAHVKSVATVAAQADWMSADVKMYVTMIAIDESLAGLKPGMSAEVTVLVDKTVDNVLIVPVQGIMGTTAMGKKRYCYVKTDTGYEEREIEVGASNEREAEIRSGLKERDEIVLNPKILEDERLRTKRPSLAEQHADDGQGTDWGKGPSPAAEIEKAEKALNQPAGPGASKGAGKKGGQGKAKGGQGAGGFQPTPEMQKMMQEWNDKYKKADTAGKKEMLDQLPEEFRERAKERLKSQGLEVPN